HLRALRFAGVGREPLRVLYEGMRGRQAIAVDGYRRAPLRERRSMLRAVLHEALREAEHPLGDGLLRALGKRLEPFVDLYARHDAARSEELRKRRAVVCLLRERLLVEDDAGQVLLDAGRSEQEIPEL